MITLHLTKSDLVLTIASDQHLIVSEPDGTLHRYPLHSLTAILVSGDNIVLDTKVLRALAEYSIDCALFEKNGDYIARWYGQKNVKSLHYKQYVYCQSSRAAKSFAEWLMLKYEGHYLWIGERIHARSDNNTAQWTKLQGLMASYQAYDAQQIITSEAQWTKCYYSVIRTLLPAGLAFGHRSRMPALDGYNALLNYCYALLYSRVEHALLSAGLDIYAGLHHGTAKGHKSLLFDAIEVFRPWSDAFVFDFVVDGEVSDADFIMTDQAVKIPKAMRRSLVKAWAEHEQMVIKWQHRQLSRMSHIYAFAKSFAKQVNRTRI